MVTVVRPNWRFPFVDAVMTIIGVIYAPMMRAAVIANVIWAPRASTESRLPVRAALSSACRRLRDLAARASKFGCGTGRSGDGTGAEQTETHGY
jgi:hypothetical protein